MTLDAYLFQDPAIVYEINESRSCKGCIYLFEILGRRGCTKGKNTTQRCKLWRDEPMTDERMEWLKELLEDWAVWMRGGGSVQGYACRSAVFSAAGTKNVEDTEREVFMSTCSAVNACIDDLSQIQQCAIQKRYLHAVWRFPRDNYAEQLLKAHDLLLISVPKRVEFV